MTSFVESFDHDALSSGAGGSDGSAVWTSTGKNQLCSQKKRETMSIASAYFVFMMCAGVVLKEFTDHDFSAVLTLGAGVQCLGFLALLLKVRAQKTVTGISSKSLEVYSLVFLFRLSSTLVKNGYIPVDRSGDWVYQAADIVSFLIVLQLLLCIHKTHRATYQAEHDTLNIWRAVPPCMLLGVFVHGDLNNSPFFDAMWAISLNLDTIALLPQLWMLTKMGGKVEALTSHFVVALTASRALAFLFWYHGFPELAPQAGGFNVSGWTIIGAHALQLLLSTDFLYHYLSSRIQGREMVLAPMFEV